MMSRVKRIEPSPHEPRSTIHRAPIVVVRHYVFRHNSASWAKGKTSEKSHLAMAQIFPAATAVRADTDVLFSALYAELHRLARRQLARQWTPARLGVTTLLHEAYLNLAKNADVSFSDRAHFMAYAARVMRGLIIDHARARSSAKSGGRFHITVLTMDRLQNPIDTAELTRISDALEELAAIEPELATIVDLRFFCGFSFSEIAAMRTISERTVQRKWEKARIYLHRSLNGDLRT
jgi:RNA polymerase sigma factor (TIGR02999 family)